MTRNVSPSFRLTAKTLTGLEPILAAELTQLGASDIETQKRAVTFSGTLETMYMANLCLRTALRVLKPIATAVVRNDTELYDAVQQVDWLEHLKVTDTLAIDSFVSSPFFRHSKYVALKAKDAIVDQFRKKESMRPSVNVENPSLRINVHLAHDRCTISLDSSGQSLHRRGYRLSRTEAPLNEVLAAGLVLMTGWDGSTPFVDPMCGSGTLLIEAGLISGNIAPGLLREHFGFMNWPDFDTTLWQRVREKAKRRRKRIAGPILGSDKSMKSVRIAQENIERARLAKAINVRRAPFEKNPAPKAPGIVLMNPPYGERLQTDDIERLYQSIGDRLKQAYVGFDAWILSGNKQALKKIGLRPSRRETVWNGSLECKFHRFNLYPGSLKSKYGVVSDEL